MHDDDDFTSFRGIVCEGQTHRHTDRHANTYTDTAFSMLTFSKSSPENEGKTAKCNTDYVLDFTSPGNE